LKISFLDSGIGGLTVLESFFTTKSSLSFPKSFDQVSYLADLHNLPYGDKSPEELKRILRHNLEYLNPHSDLVVLACNTSSAILDENIKAEFPELEIIGLIQTFGETFEAYYGDLKEIIVLSTQATHNSKAYIQSMQSQNSGLRLQSIACPEWVPFIENKLLNSPIQEEIHIRNQAKESTLAAQAIIDKVIQRFEFAPQALVLGCTHYPLLAPYLKKALPHVQLIDPALSVRSKLDSYCLMQNSLLSSPAEGRKINLYSSAHTDSLTGKLRSLDKMLTCVKHLSSPIQVN
jgi:glutamate racemase